MRDLTISPWRHWRWLLAGLALLVLNGCASVYRVDNRVQSFPRWDASATPTPPQTYQFERLPSQREGQAAAAQDALEELARAALARVGWNRAEGKAPTPWTVQVSAQGHQLPRAPWEEPWADPWGGFGMFGQSRLFLGHGGGLFWGSSFMRMDTPYHQRKVSLLIRQAASGQLVYETHAQHDGRWNSTPELWSAMLDAALRDFPTPPAGARQVNIEVPR
ncbi:MAG: DUF4136 domain-containing protein [Comamonadaceae bacterium]|nr:DUF4136 domain-containing protein [Comamonadaceae bacterium]